MRLESLSFLCLTFLIQRVSSQSHTIVTQTTTVAGQVQTNIFSIDFGGPTQTIHGIMIEGGETLTVSAIIASNTINVEESLTDSGGSARVELQCSVHDGNQGDCIGIIMESLLASTILTTTTLATTFPPGGLFGSLPTGVSSSSSQSTPAPAPVSPSSSTSLSSPAAPSPLPTSSPSPTSSSVSNSLVTDPSSSSVTPSPTSAPSSSTTNSTSPTLGPSNIDMQLPALNSGSSLSFPLFPQVGILMATYILSIFAA